MDDGNYRTLIRRRLVDYPQDKCTRKRRINPVLQSWGIVYGGSQTGPTTRIISKSRPTRGTGQLGAYRFGEFKSMGSTSSPRLAAAST